MDTTVSNFITFDIEEWYHANYTDIEFSNYQDKSTRLEENINTIISICKKYNVRSTCFILGCVAEAKPHLIKKLYDAGHEIASHGYSHSLVYNMTPSEFRADLKKSCDILEKIIKEKIVGYRAPSWSVKEENLGWFYQVLEEQGIQYSSSIYPAYTYLYGVQNFKELPHFPEVHNMMSKVLEIPVPVFGVFNKKIGFTGGFYLRFFPLWIIKILVDLKIKKGHPFFIYLHPRELDPLQEKLNLNFVERIIHYHGIGSTTHRKLVCLIKKYMKIGNITMCQYKP